jgi:predicted MPP superfamily phosphohydrolase
MTKFAALYDLHFGYERKNRHKIALHDMKAFNAAYQFLKDFKPDVLILGGDWLDCGMVSHHNHGKPGRVEGFRLEQDGKDCREQTLVPLEKLKAKKYVYIIGNHEDWLDDFHDERPMLEGLVELRDLLGLGPKWQLISQGKSYSLGKLTFIHGDQIKGGEHCAKAAVTTYERNVRFGHHHTYQAFTKTSALDIKLGRTGIAVPCLCTKDPKYGEGKANRWQQGLNFGYVLEDGTFRDYVAIILNGRMVVNGKMYRG